MFKSGPDLIDELVFLSLKLIDGATLFSKEEVIKEYESNKNDENIEELLYNKAIYPNGEQLGFYNTSRYSLNDFYNINLPKTAWNEYLNGFSNEIKQLFNNPRFSPILWEYFKDYDIELLEKREDINDFYLDYFNHTSEYDGEYINYDDLKDYFNNILFEGIQFKEKTSILHIGADNTFIISCLNYIRDINPNCDIELYIITSNDVLTFALNFLAIINKARFFHVTDFYNRSRHIDYDVYNKLFDYHKNFDFVIQTDSLDGRMQRYSSTNREGKGNYIPDYGVTISSRSIYVLSYEKIKLYDDWLEDDLLESLILIPYKNKSPSSKYFKFALLMIFNHNKSEERKNKFLVIDNNENKTISSKEYNLENYEDSINNKNIYRNSHNLFSKFINSEYSKLFDVKNFSNNKLFCFNNEMYDVKMNAQKKYYKTEHFKGNERIIKHLNYRIERLRNLINKKIGYENSESNKYLYIFKRGELFADEQWVFLNHEIIDIEQCYEYELISDKITLEYLYYYLNSEIGLNEYNYFSRGEMYLQGIMEIRVPIPPKNIQDKIVEAMNERNDFLNDVKLLKNRTDHNFFDYEQNKSVVGEFYGKRKYSSETQELSMPDNWIYTYGGLVWPLAITYLIATSGGFEKVEKANNLLKLFEFTTAFNAIVLISGLPEEIYERNKHKIWKKAYDERNDDGFVNSYKLTFGSWVTFHYKIKKIYKKRFDTEIDKEFYSKLLNNNIIEYYRTLKDHRNKEFHEGFVNPSEAESVIKELNIPKTKVFNYLNECYKNYRLFYITGKNDTSTNEHEIIFLNGPYSMPIYSTIHYKGFLEAEALYLYDEEEKKFCKLNSKLIKFMPIDEDKHDWRLYIFIGFENDCEGNKIAKYKCYQRLEDELEVHFDLKELL